MGIPKFYGNWLARNVKQAIINGVPNFVASLSFDLNGVFHDARNRVFGDNKDPRFKRALENTDLTQLELEMENEIASIILKMVQEIKPRDCLILAVDGVAPGAKLQQQRSRREKSAKEFYLIDYFDRNAITPGTEFMMRLDNFLVRFIGKYREYLPDKVIYSGHLVAGEGEHKIMEYYRKGELDNGPAALQGGAHLIYGLDADFVMLSLLSPVSNIYLSRETTNQVVNIDNIKNYLIENSNSRLSAVHDFVVILFLIGNDFLPHSPSLEEISDSIIELLEVYFAGNYVLTTRDDNGNNNINWEEMAKYINEISTKEDGWLANLSVATNSRPSPFLLNSLVDNQFYPETFRNLWYNNALGYKSSQSLQETIAKLTGRNHNISVDDIQNMVLSYLKTINWIYLYYSRGTSAINQDWSYLYHHTPLLKDISYILNNFNYLQYINGYQSHANMLQFTSLHQLVAVLPLKSKNLVPIELHPLYEFNSIIRDLFPENFITEMDTPQKGVAILPFIDRQRIYDAVAQMPFIADRAKLWLPATDEFFIRSPEEQQYIIHLQHNQQTKSIISDRQNRYQSKSFTHHTNQQSSNSNNQQFYRPNNRQFYHSNNQQFSLPTNKQQSHPNNQQIIHQKKHQLPLYNQTKNSTSSSQLIHNTSPSSLTSSQPLVTTVLSPPSTQQSKPLNVYSQTFVPQSFATTQLISSDTNNVSAKINIPDSYQPPIQSQPFYKVNQVQVENQSLPTTNNVTVTSITDIRNRKKNLNPSLLNSNPITINSNPSLLNSNPITINSNPITINSNPPPINSNPITINSNPPLINSNPQLTNNRPLQTNWNNLANLM